jgi:hypothetical protein
VERAFVMYFQNLFTLSNPIFLDWCLEGLSPKVANLMNEQLIRLCSKEEINLPIA